MWRLNARRFSFSSSDDAPGIIRSPITTASATITEAQPRQSTDMTQFSRARIAPSSVGMSIEADTLNIFSFALIGIPHLKHMKLNPTFSTELPLPPDISCPLAGALSHPPLILVDVPRRPVATSAVLYLSCFSGESTKTDKQGGVPLDAAGDIYQALFDLWQQYFRSRPERGALIPLIYKPKPATLLFVGLNPSFDGKAIERIAKASPALKIQVPDFFRWSTYKRLDRFPSVVIQNAQNFETAARTRKDDEDPYLRQHYKTYFGPLESIAGEVLGRQRSRDWEHIDLFFYRKTKQRSLVGPILKKKADGGEKESLTDFGARQIKLSTRLILDINPKIIVVTSALASRLFAREFNARFSESDGHHFARVNRTDMPVFLGGMLSGQHAMDSFSSQRLTWHIKRAWERLSGPE